MTHELAAWIIWLLMSIGRPMVGADFAPYDGPLAERRITAPLPEYSANFTILVDSPELAAFERRLRRQPIHVLAPGHRYAGWGLRTYPEKRGVIFVIRFNLLLTAAEQPLGPWRPHGGDMLRWAFGVLDHYQLAFDPIAQGKRRTRAQFIEWYSSDSTPIDWHAVAELLRTTGRPVPADLFDQPTR